LRNSILFFFSIYALVIYTFLILGINTTDFDDYHNYLRLFNDVANSSNFSDLYKDIGITYYFKLFSLITSDYLLVVKLTIFIFLVFFLAIFWRRKNYIGFYCTLVVFTNRWFIEGAFNFFRAWFVMMLFSCLIVLINNYALKKVVYFLPIIVLMMLFHLQAAILQILIFAYVLVIIKFWNLLLLRLSLLALPFFSFLYIDDTYLELLTIYNQNAVFGDSELSIQQLYMFYSPAMVALILVIFNKSIKYREQFKLFFIYVYLITSIWFVYPLAVRYFLIAPFLLTNITLTLNATILLPSITFLNIFFIFYVFY